MNIILGSHVSFGGTDQLLGSVKEALSYGSNTFMFYTGAPQNTNRKAISDEKTKEAKKLMEENNININNVIVHAPYIINLARNDDFAIDFLKKEIERCHILGISKLVLHPGNAVSLEKSIAINNIINGLNSSLDNNYNVMILLETMAGKGTEIGSSFEEIKTIIEGIKYQDKIGVCLDTCHINDAGYKINNFDNILEEFNKIIGLDKLKCIHVNDSKNIEGSKKDRHENFGYGSIGFDKLIGVIYHDKLIGIPKILETPYVTKDDNEKERLYPPYKFEIEMIKNKILDKELINKIRNYYRGGKNE